MIDALSQGETAERIAALDSSLQRLEKRLAMVERTQTARPSPVPVAPHLAALAWLKSATELSDSRIASLLMVTRQTLTRWRNGEAIDAGKRRHLLAVRDVLERAAQNYPTPQELGAWLDTPQGSDGRTPSNLLAQGNIDKARLFAVTKGSSPLAPLPTWLKQTNTRLHDGSDRDQALSPWYDAVIAGQDAEEQDVFVPLRPDAE